ncbi:FAD-binding oxidoreductase [Bdellovibrio sp.]|uniref:FAD-binding oxidoreductase n=1 Tax=Bdellovibrio sp. TaxID=28201 RepID=UPI0039E28973
MGAQEFLSFCKDLLGQEFVSIPSSPQSCVSGFTRELTATVSPRSKEEVVQIVKAANDFLVRLYPISRGRNWGFGSSLPTQDDLILLDLSRLNRIHQVDLDHGYAIVEPGVTQKAMADHLTGLNAPYFLDVTGSSSDSSIIGNALERGIAYHSLRVETISSLEIVLGSGEVIKTGFAQDHRFQSIGHLYKHGVGPSLDGLFFQSNFGIVVSATIQLLPRPEEQCSFTIALEDEKNLLPLLNAIRPLLENQVLRCIPHVFNQGRLYGGMAPLLADYFKAQGESWSKESIHSYMSKHLPGKWFAVGVLSGTAEEIKSMKQALRKIAKSCGGACTLLDERINRIIRVLLKLPFLKEKRALFHVSQVVRGLTIGVPTEKTLPSIWWPITPQKELQSPDQLDSGKAGFIYNVPFVPFKSQDVERMLKEVYSTLGSSGFEYAITLNLVTPQVVEAVISIHYERDVKEQVDKVHNLVRRMTENLNDLGYPQYRTNIAMMDLVVDSKSDYWQVVKRLKSVFDPKGVIAPGRYCPE